MQDINILKLYIKLQRVRANIGPKLLKSFNQLANQLLADTTKYALELATNKHSSNHILYNKYKRLIAKEKDMRFRCHIFWYIYIETHGPTLRHNYSNNSILKGFN